MSKCVLLIDMDGVLCDWAGKLRENFVKAYPERNLLPHEKLVKFYVEELHAPDWHDDIKAVIQAKNFYSDLEPLPRAIEALKDMEEYCSDFLEPFICSSPDVDSTDLCCHTEKAAWVEKHLGSFWTKRLVLTKDKTLVRGHFLIDDKPKIEGKLAPTWNHVVYSQPWNAEHEFRFTWDDWGDFRDQVIIPKFKEDNTAEEKSVIVLPSRDLGSRQ